MRRVSLLLAFLLTWSLAGAVDLVTLEIEIRETWNDRPDDYIIADYDKINLVLGKENHVFLGSVSMSLTPQIKDFNTLQIQADVYSLPPKIQSFFRQITLAKNQPWEVVQISGKSGRSYRIIFKNWQPPKGEIDCSDDPSDNETWAGDFSTHFSYHYVKNSLADYLWNYNSAYLENEFGRIRKFYDVYPLTKIELYHHHCFYPGSNWNRGLGVALFPAKKEIRVLFGPERKSLDAPHLHVFMLLNQWGYAPLFMTHGLSGFFTLNHFYAKQDLLQGKSIPWDSLFNSASYRRQDQKRAFHQSASWTRFLIENFTQHKVIEFYKEVSDINVRELTEKYFGQLDQLQKKWRDSLKDYWPTAEDLHFFAKLATGMGDYPTALELYLALGQNYPEHKVSSDLGNAYYLTGDYANALLHYKKWVAEDSANPNRHFVLGNIFWLNGNLAEAEGEYLRALQIDSGFGSAALALARFYWDRKDTLKCGEFLKRIPGQKIDRVEEPGFNLLQAEYLRSKNQLAAADSLALYARNLAKFLVNQAPEQSHAYLLLGEALLACDSLEKAKAYLEVAHLLEDRPYYRGQVYLSLAELHLKLQDAGQAKFYLGEVLNTSSGYREKNIAQKLFSGL